MYTVLLAFGISLVVVFVPVLFGLGPEWTVIPGMVLGVGGFIWMSRRIAKRVEAVTQAADAELATLQQVAQSSRGNMTAIGKKFDRAIGLLQKGFVLERWQFGVATMLNARIGMIIFSRHLVIPSSTLADAIPYLERSRVRGKKAKLLQGLWPAWAMLAVCYYQAKKDTEKALAVLEEATRIATKDALLRQLHAWILWKENRLDDAIEVLVNARKTIDDERIVENLTALQNRKGMKMRGYGEQWYQFGLEKPKVAGTQPRMAHPRAKARAGVRRR